MDVLKSIGTLMVTGNVGTALALKGHSVVANMMGVIGLVTVGTIIKRGIDRRRE